MANEKRIIVEIISTHKNENPENQEGSPEDVGEKNSGSTKSKAKKVEAMLAVDKITSMISTGVKSSMSRYFSMSENYMAETDFQNTMITIEKGKSFAKESAKSIDKKERL